MIKYLRIMDSYFKVLSKSPDGSTLTTDRSMGCPYKLWPRLLWLAKNEWYKIKWGNAPENERIEFKNE